MNHSADPLDARAIQALLDAAGAAFRLDVRQSCPSTNTELMQRAHAGAPHRQVLVCEAQTAGRGRRGRRWESVPGGSLTFSLLWRFAPGSPPPVGLSLAAGVAVAQALEQLGAPVQLKWPNDILLGERKLGGILVELASGAGTAAVIGIGLNLRLPGSFAVDSDLQPGDLASALPELPPRNALLARLLVALDEVLVLFAREGFPALRESWLARQAWRDRPVRVAEEPGPARVGRCAGVDADGALLLATDAGIERILSGDLSLRPLP